MTPFSAPPRAAASSSSSSSSSSSGTSTGTVDASLLDIEALLGYRPRASIVLYLRRRRRPPVALRVDLPPGLAHDVEETARALTGLVARVTGASSAEVVVYARASDDRSLLSHYAPAIDALRSRLGAAGFEVPRMRLVLDGEWAEIGDARAAAARPHWHRMPRHPAGDGREPRAAPDHPLDPHHGPYVPVARASEHRRTRAMAALGVLHDALPEADRSLPSDDSEGAEPQDIVEVLVRWSAVLAAAAESTLPSDARAVALVWSLQHKVVRDCVLMVCAWGLDAGVLALHESREPAAATVGATGVYDTFLGVGARPPGPATLRTAIDLLRHLASCVPESIAAPVHTLLAWLEWARGRGTVATAYLEACRQIDPGYRLALLLGVMIDHGFVPEWIGGDSGTTLCPPR